MGGGAFRWGEVVAPGDLPPLVAQPAQAAQPLVLGRVQGRRRVGGEVGVLGGAGVAHLVDQVEFLGLGGGRRDPDPGLAAPLEDLVGQPLQVFARPGVIGQGDDVVRELRHSEFLELSPQGDPRCGRFPGQSVAQQHPLAARRGGRIVHSRNETTVTP